MDGWGSLTMLIKRQNASKYRKAKNRYEHQKKKEQFLNDYPSELTQLEFPEISPQRLEALKLQIRKRVKRNHTIKVIVYSIVIATCTLLYLYYLKGGFANA